MRGCGRTPCAPVAPRARRRKTVARDAERKVARRQGRSSLRRYAPADPPRRPAKPTCELHMTQSAAASRDARARPVATVVVVAKAAFRVDEAKAMPAH